MLAHGRAIVKIDIEMKGVVYVVALLSLPNLLVGVMAVVIRHTFATFNPLQIVIN